MCTMVAPASRALPTRSTVFFSMPVESITDDTAPCRLPPSVVKSFWYSMSTSAVWAGSTAGVGEVMAFSCRGRDHRQ